MPHASNIPCPPTQFPLGFISAHVQTISPFSIPLAVADIPSAYTGNAFPPFPKDNCLTPTRTFSIVGWYPASKSSNHLDLSYPLSCVRVTLSILNHIVSPPVHTDYTGLSPGETEGRSNRLRRVSANKWYDMYRSHLRSELEAEIQPRL